jgi:hypothetical protein
MALLEEARNRVQSGPQTPSPPSYPQVAPQSYGEVGKKKSWWRDHIGASRVHHCQAAGCGWSGTMAEMECTNQFRDRVVPIMKSVRTGSTTNPYETRLEVDGSRIVTEKIAEYSCPKCHRLVKRKI